MKPVTHKGNGSRRTRSLRHLGEVDLCDPLSLTADFYDTGLHLGRIPSDNLRQSDVENGTLNQFSNHELYMQV